MHYFIISAHLAPLVAPAMRPDSLPRLWRYINLLLTYLLKTLLGCLANVQQPTLHCFISVFHFIILAVRVMC